MSSTYGQTQVGQTRQLVVQPLHGLAPGVTGYFHSDVGLSADQFRNAGPVVSQILEDNPQNQPVYSQHRFERQRPNHPLMTPQVPAKQETLSQSTTNQLGNFVQKLHTYQSFYATRFEPTESTENQLQFAAASLPTVPQYQNDQNQNDQQNDERNVNIEAYANATSQQSSSAITKNQSYNSQSSQFQNLDNERLSSAIGQNNLPEVAPGTQYNPNFVSPILQKYPTTQTNGSIIEAPQEETSSSFTSPEENIKIEGMQMDDEDIGTHGTFSPNRLTSESQLPSQLFNVNDERRNKDLMKSTENDVMNNGDGPTLEPFRPRGIVIERVSTKTRLQGNSPPRGDRTQNPVDIGGVKPPSKERNEQPLRGSYNNRDDNLNKAQLNQDQHNKNEYEFGRKLKAQDYYQQGSETKTVNRQSIQSQGRTGSRGQSNQQFFAAKEHPITQVSYLNHQKTLHSEHGIPGNNFENTYGGYQENNIASNSLRNSKKTLFRPLDSHNYPRGYLNEYRDQQNNEIKQDEPPSDEASIEKQVENPIQGGRQSKVIRIKGKQPAQKINKENNLQQSDNAETISTPESLDNPEESLNGIQDLKTLSKNDKEAVQSIFQKQAENAKYSFQTYFKDTINDNSQTRAEVRDGLKLKGFYSYSDGYYKRTVHYIADENGYRVVK